MRQGRLWQRGGFLRGTLAMLVLGVGLWWGLLGDSRVFAEASPLSEAVRAQLATQIRALTGGGG